MVSRLLELPRGHLGGTLFKGGVTVTMGPARRVMRAVSLEPGPRIDDDAIVEVARDVPSLTLMLREDTWYLSHANGVPWGPSNVFQDGAICWGENSPRSPREAWNLLWMAPWRPDTWPEYQEHECPEMHACEGGCGVVHACDGGCEHECDRYGTDDPHARRRVHVHDHDHDHDAACRCCDGTCYCPQRCRCCAETCACCPCLSGNCACQRDCDCCDGGCDCSSRCECDLQTPWLQHVMTGSTWEEPTVAVPCGIPFGIETCAVIPGSLTMVRRDGTASVGLFDPPPPYDLGARPITNNVRRLRECVSTV